MKEKEKVTGISPTEVTWEENAKRIVRECHQLGTSSPQVRAHLLQRAQQLTSVTSAGCFASVLVIEGNTRKVCALEAWKLLSDVCPEKPRGPS